MPGNFIKVCFQTNEPESILSPLFRPLRAPIFTGARPAFLVNMRGTSNSQNLSAEPFHVAGIEKVGLPRTLKSPKPVHPIRAYAQLASKRYLLNTMQAHAVGKETGYGFLSAKKFFFITSPIGEGRKSSS